MKQQPPIQVPPVVPTEVSKTDGVIEQWFMDHFHNTVGWDTATYNRFYAAKEDLKAKITAALKEA